MPIDTIDHIFLRSMAYLHCLKHTWTPTQIRTPNPMATLYFTETVPISQTWTAIQIQIKIQIPDGYP